MNTKEKIIVFYLENENSITFFSTTTEVKLILNKTENNYKEFNKILKSNLYDFKKLV